VFRTPIYQKPIKLDVFNLFLPNGQNDNGLIVLKKITDSDAGFSITTGTVNSRYIDGLDTSFNNCIIGNTTTGVVNSQTIYTQLYVNDSSRTESFGPTVGALRVGGGVGVTGNVFIGGNVSIGKQMVINKPFSSAIANTQMDVSGNVIFSRLGLSTIAMNTNSTLDVSGPITQFNGFVWQF